MRGLILSGMFFAWCNGAVGQAIVEVPPRPSQPEVLFETDLGAEERTFTQLIWDAEREALDRATYGVWDILAQDALALTWEPLAAAEASGPLSGEGLLSWRNPGQSPMRRESVVAQYRGTFQRGRAVGNGTFWHRSGVLYRGEWLGGLFHGEGRLQWADGREYVGAFADGLPDGEGWLLFPDGAIYQGDFSAGLPDGEGILYPTDRAAERVTWRFGEDRPTIVVPMTGADSMAHLLQAQQTQGDVTLALSLSANASLPELWLPYLSESDGQTLRVQPGAEGFMERWRGIEPLRTADGPARFWAGADPIPFVVQMENRSTAPVQVVAMFLEVDESRVDRHPALWTYTHGCRGEDVGVFEIHRASGAEPTAARIEGSFGRSDDGMPIGPVSADVVMSWPLRIDFGALVSSLGGNLSALSNSPVDCQGVDADTCMENLRSEGAFGALSGQVYRRRDCLLADFVGTVSYDWTDHTGEMRSQSRMLEAEIGIGALASNASIAEFGDGLIQVPEAFEFVLGATNYRMSLGLTTVTPPGRAERWEFYIEAASSMEARFRVVFQLADGREIRSRDILLSYYRAN